MIGLHNLNNQVAILLVDFDVWCGMYVARLFFRKRVDLCASRQWRIQAGEGEEEGDARDAFPLLDPEFIFIVFGKNLAK